MTIQERLSGRISLLQDFKVTVDETDDMIYFHYNRKLDCTVTWLKHLTSPRFTALLEHAQEAYCKHHQEP